MPHDAHILRAEADVRRLVADFALAANLRDYELFTSTWSVGGVWRISEPIDVTITGCHAINDGIRGLLESWAWFVQIPHTGSVVIDGDRGHGRWLMTERARPAQKPGGHFNHGIYEDVYVLERGVWKFERRTYHYLYLDDTEPQGQGFRPVLAERPS